jgi:hypothetical protein
MIIENKMITLIEVDRNVSVKIMGRSAGKKMYKKYLVLEK